MSTRYRPRSWPTATAALEHKLAECGLSYPELQKRTGLIRQSIMRFCRGEGSLRLDLADKLIQYFDLRVVERPARKRPAKKSKGR